MARLLQSASIPVRTEAKQPMKLVHKLLLACLPLGALAACGGGDTADRLDVADPVVRFVHAAPIAPNVTLYRDTVAQPDATNVAYQFASNYFDVDMGVADWSVKTAAGGIDVGAVSIDPLRGTKYTVVAYTTSATANAVALISDPYNKPLTSDSAHLRLMNASFNAANVDVYMNTPGTDIGQRRDRHPGRHLPADDHDRRHEDGAVQGATELRQQPGHPAADRAGPDRAGLGQGTREGRGHARSDGGSGELITRLSDARRAPAARCSLGLRRRQDPTDPGGLRRGSPAAAASLSAGRARTERACAGRDRCASRRSPARSPGRSRRRCTDPATPDRSCAFRPRRFSRSHA